MSDLFDIQALAGAFSPTSKPTRFRVGVVQSIQTDRTCTVLVAGSTTPISGVKYLAGAQPLPNSPVWLISDGLDVFAFGVIAAANRTYAATVARGAALTVLTATDTYPTFGSVFYDPWDSFNGTNRLVAKMSGRYMAVATVEFAANGTGVRALWVEDNSGYQVARVQVPAASANPTNLTVSTHPHSLAVGDWVRMGVRQTSGGNLDLNVGGNNVAFSLIYLGP